MPRRRRCRGILGFSIADVVAVREIVARQTPLRQEICQLLALGCSQREAAERLGMSPERVHYHVRELRRAFIEAGFEGAAVGQTRRKRRTPLALARVGERRREKKWPAASERKALV